MAPISLKIVLDEGAVVKTVAFDSTMRVREAFDVIMEKLHSGSDGKHYALFLTSATDDLSGVWLEDHRTLEYYMLRDGDSLYCLDRMKNLRVKMLDGSVKTLQVDTSKTLGDLMMIICDKIRITNPDEYGLCREETKTVEEAKPTSIIGTLTLKRKAQQKEKDPKMEQLSKKLKTDDNVSWLDQHKTLREVGVDSNETLLLKRRLFYSDRNVDSRDPVQLNLLYVQTRDAILEGRHPVTEEQALQFAGIQCQIQYGDHQEEIHKPGLIENLNEYLPVQYSSTWSAEKKILKLHKKHAGLSQLEAKHLYTKTARELPTYGVTFFLVKERHKGKKKMVPRLLGISSEAILRLDETTKEVLQTWPLTQVKTYQASQNDTFSLNFGDYSEKEYSVKTNDAYRIRDILEGYIDITRKRQGAPYGAELPDSDVVMQESVQHGRSNVVTHVTHVPVKAVEHCYIGPSRIVQEGQAGDSSHGTQIVTVQQMLVTQRGTTRQQAVTSEFPMRRDMPLQFTRKLNKMNANSVKIVTLLSDSNPENLKEVQKILEEMEADMPNITQGVTEVADKQKAEVEKQKLLAELDELQRLLNSLSSVANQENMDPDDIQDVAKKIADLTTQMYLNLDPRTKKQSKILRTSRQSFIEDDKLEANLHRASFIVAAGSACGAIDNTKKTLTQEHDDPVPTELERQALEVSVVDKMGKINAALAMLLTSHSDPNNPDYSAAVMSMNTINELVPELAKDAKSVSRSLDSESSQSLVEDMVALCNAARQICALVGSEDKEKMQDATETYTEISGRLLFRFGRNPRAVDSEKSDECCQIIDLANEAVAATTMLLIQVNELTSLEPDNDASAKVDAEGVKCGDAARFLLLCAQLTAPSIHEPHCQSALTAAVENLSSSSQTLALAWRSLVEDPSRAQIGEDLRERTMDVAKTLDRLRNAYGNLQGAESIEQEQEPTPEKVLRLRFITSASNAQSLVKAAADQLDKPLEDISLSLLQRKEIESNLTDAIAQVNAAVASLMQAVSDPRNPDNNTAQLAMGTISELMLIVVQDVNKLSASSLEMGYRKALLDDMRTWFEAVNAVCAGATNDTTQELNNSAQQFAAASQKLSFVFSPRAYKAREQLLLELSSLAHERATALVDDSNKMADLVGGPNALRQRGRGHAVDSAARAFSATAQLTVPHIENSLCRSALLTSTEALSSSARDLVSESQDLQDDETGCKVLEAKVYQQRQNIENKGILLNTALQGMKEICWIVDGSNETPTQKSQRLKFIATLPTAQKKLEAVEERINSTPSSKKLNEVEAKLLKDKLEKDLVTLKSAVIAIIQAKSDPLRKDFVCAEEAICTITNLMPSIIDDTKAITNCDKKADINATLDYLRALNDALKGICVAVERDDAKDLDTSAKKIAEVSEKLSFVFHPRKKQPKEEQMTTLCTSASAEASRMVETARRAAPEFKGVARYQLSEGADRLQNASDVLVTSAQLTASSINDPQHKTALTSSADNLQSTAQALVALVQAVSHHNCKEEAEELERRAALLKDIVNKIKLNINAEDKNSRAPPPVPVKKSTLTFNPQNKEEENHYQLPKTVAKAIKTSDMEKLATQNFLDTLRAEESSNKFSIPTIVDKNNEIEIKENKKLEQDLAKTLQNSEKVIKTAIIEVQKVKNTSTKALLSEEEKELLQKNLEEKLASASVAAASLLVAKHRHYLDYNVAENSIHKLSAVMPEIAKDIATLSTIYDDKRKKALLEEALRLCEGAKNLCNATPNDIQKFNEVAVEVGDSIARLLYRVSPYADPQQEKHVIEAAKAIGDSAYRVAVAGANVMRGVDETHAQAVCDAGSKTAHTAGVLVYTAKLVAPSIHHKECQNQLINASKDLSSDLVTYTSTFKTLQPEGKDVTDLTIEAENLEKLLQGFRLNLGEGKLVKRKALEKIVIEDTVLRQLAVKILQNAETRTKSTELPQDARRKYETYYNKLSEAIKSLDVANHKCHEMPDELNKRKQLESSIQNLQFILLQSRPTINERQQNIVDLTDYVKEVSEETEKLSQIVDKINLTQCEKPVMIIKDECNSIKQNAVMLINPAELPNTEDSLGGILEVDQFGQDCDTRNSRIKSALDLIEDKQKQIILEDGTVTLSESINLLRFATKSALTGARSAALDETIDDLMHLQKNIGILLTSGAENNVILDETSSPALMASRALLVRSTMEVSSGNARALASAVTAYVTDARDVTPASHGDRLKIHANKVIESLKLLVAATITRVAMFERIPDAELIKITQRVLQEIENYTITDNKAEKIQVISESDVATLFLPTEIITKGEDQKSVAEKLLKVSTKLNSLIETVYQSASKPESLSRTVKVTLDTVVDLANTAKALKTGDTAQDKKIDDDVDNVIWSTFGLFKAAESVTNHPKNDAAKRSLLDACRLLNDSINKLARTANSSKSLKTQCSEYKRILHTQELLNRNYLLSSICSVPFAECISELENQQNVLTEAMKLDSDEPMSRKGFTESLGFVSSAVCNSTKFAAHSAYLLSISESNKQVATEGVVDVMKLREVTSSMKDSALNILRSQQIEQMKSEEIQVMKSVEDLKTIIEESSDKIDDEKTRQDLIDGGAKVDATANVLRNAVLNKDTDMENIHTATALFLNAVGALRSVVERPTMAPQIIQASSQAKAMSEDVLEHSKGLMNKAQDLMTNVSSYDDEHDEGPMTWVTFNTSRKSLLDALEKLINCLRENGQKAGIIAVTEPEETVTEEKSYLQLQVDAVNKWLDRRPLKPEVKVQGEQATRNILDIGEKMLDDLNDNELEDMRQLLTETEELLKECSKSYDAVKARALIDKTGDLRKAIERCIVSRVVDDFTEAEEPMADLEAFVDIETDEKKRKFLLEQKIAELLAQLGKVRRTARVVADVRGGVVSQELEKCSQQTELLAPQLIKAAEERVRTPHSPQVVEDYRTQLAQYAESLSKVRDLCDRSVDPMEFVQTAGDKMQRLREESRQNSEQQRCVYTSIVIRRLANRVIEVGMSSSNAREDAEIMEVLSEAKKKLAAPPPARASRLPDWRTTTAEMLRATSEVESVLGGESIFKKQPEPDQPIYNAALSLHTVVREWSARDNEVVAVAKRMAVLMAKLSDYMNHDKKAELIATSKSIVVESHEVARLARKLALECSDLWIRTNLLQACERIPTISGQLKMLTTVKGSSLGHQRSEDDKEAMDMLVGNAQNLMLSVQDVVKGAESASVKIASQRGMRIKWVRKNYY